MQWIGARSYSFYLWHWPLLASLRITYPEIPSLSLAAIPISLALACLAYTYIEEPLHKGRLLARPLNALTAAGAGLVVIFAVGYATAPALRLLNKDLANRLAQIQALSEDVPQIEAEKCFLNIRQVDNPPCHFGDPAASRRAVIFGDSHAAQWFNPLNAAARQTGWQLLAWTKADCPWVDVPIEFNGLYEACNEWRQKTMAQLTGPNHRT